MTSAKSRVLVIGIDPEALDPSAWNVTSEQAADVRGHIASGEAALREAGFAVETVLIAVDAPVEAALVPRIRERRWACVIVGGGIRKPPELLSLFEQVVNAVHHHAPSAAIAFNTEPNDLLAAVRRQIGPAHRPPTSSSL